MSLLRLARKRRSSRHLQLLEGKKNRILVRKDLRLVDDESGGRGRESESDPFVEWRGGEEKGARAREVFVCGGV